jgi:hypothetical protein
MEITNAQGMVYQFRRDAESSVSLLAATTKWDSLLKKAKELEWCLI